MMNSKVYITKEELLTNINIQMMDEVNIKIIENLYVSEADKNEMYIVGCKIEEKFIKLPKIALDIINYIKNCNNVSNISNYIGDDIEYKDFVISLIGLGFIEQYGEYQIIKPSDSSNVKRFGLKLKSKYLNKPYVDIYFSRKFISILIITFVLFFVVKLIEYFYYGHDVIPNIEEFNYIPNLLFLYFLFYSSDIVLGLYHETAHVVAARYYGIQNININIGRRLIHLVYQTQIPNTWSVSKKGRRIMYLSGMIADCFLITLITIIGHFFLLQGLIVLYYIMRIITLTLLLGILFELKLYMRTDIYYLISDSLELPNLHQDSVKLLKNIKNWFGASKQLRIYTVIMLLSSTIEIIIFLKFIIPFFVFSAENILQAFSRFPNNSLNDYGNFLATILIVGELCFLIFIYLKEKIKTKNEEIYKSKVATRRK